MQMQAESLVDLVHDRSREPAEDRPEALYGDGAHLLGFLVPVRGRSAELHRGASVRPSPTAPPHAASSPEDAHSAHAAA